MAVARFKVSGKFNGKASATVLIDRTNLIISIRPKGLRKSYELRLSDVAEWVMWKVIEAEQGLPPRRKP